MNHLSLSFSCTGQYAKKLSFLGGFFRLICCSPYNEYVHGESFMSLIRFLSQIYGTLEVVLGDMRYILHKSIENVIHKNHFSAN